MIFALVCVGHAARLALGWEIVLHVWKVPMWVSVFGLVVTGALSFLLWREARAK